MGMTLYAVLVQLSSFASVALWLAQIVLFAWHIRLSRWMWLLIVGAALQMCGSGLGRLLVTLVRPVGSGTGGTASWQVAGILFTLLSLGALVGALVYLAGLFAVLGDLSRRLRGGPNQGPEPVEQPLWPDG